MDKVIVGVNRGSFSVRTGLRKGINKQLWIVLKKAALVCSLLVALSTSSFAEIKIYTYTLKQPFGGSQSPDDARISAIARAKREVLERAGTHLETLTVVRENVVVKDEIIALAAGVLKAEIVSQKNYATEDAFGIIVIARVEVDTSILEKRVQRLLDDRERLEKNRESQRRESQLLAKIRELEERNKTLLNGSTQERERKREDVRKQFHQTTKGLTAVDLVREAASIYSTNPRQAEALLNQAIVADPKNAEAHFYLGILYTSKKDFHKAIKAYENAIALAPSSPDAFFNLGFLYYSTRNYAMAEEMFGQVVLLGPPYVDEALFNLAVVQNLLGKRKVSIRNLEATLEINPNNDRARKYLLRLKRFDS